LIEFVVSHKNSCQQNSCQPSAISSQQFKISAVFTDG
jgi:hypothetical protein